MTLLTIAKKYKIRVTKKNKFGKRVSRTQREILKDILKKTKNKFGSSSIEKNKILHRLDNVVHGNPIENPGKIYKELIEPTSEGEKEEDLESFFSKKTKSPIFKENTQKPELPKKIITKIFTETEKSNFNILSPNGRGKLSITQSVFKPITFVTTSPKEYQTIDLYNNKNPLFINIQKQLSKEKAATPIVSPRSSDCKQRKFVSAKKEKYSVLKPAPLSHESPRTPRGTPRTPTGTPRGTTRRTDSIRSSTPRDTRRARRTGRVPPATGLGDDVLKAAYTTKTTKTLEDMAESSSI